jgi:predicted nucleotidyltransferase component of viral defense system
MNLHENKDAFQNAIRAASDHLGIRELFVEKDYWVTLILWRLSFYKFHQDSLTIRAYEYFCVNS